MAEKYPFKDIEPKWQQWWEAHGVYHAEDPDKTEKQKFYGLVEFPYPSGEGLHVGHPRSYTAIDLITRKRRMQDKNVMYPIGWDAFGLPAENFAIKKKIHPSIVTTQNIATFKRQIQSLGLGFDWTREINTTDPAYYRWTQWMFIQFYESWYDEKMEKARSIQELVIPQDVELKGQEAIRAYKDAERMAYKAKTTINWCPKDKIGLSNEEAQGGICDRCGGPVEKREKEQWMFRITKYADRLIKELDQVDYLEKIKTQQINWIGKSEGALVQFKIQNSKLKIDEILLATANETKIERVRKIVGQINTDIKINTLSDLNIGLIDVHEGSDLQKNASMKAKAYAGKTSLPVLGMDSGFFIKGEESDPAKVRRNALQGEDESKLSREEIAKKMVAYYQKIAKRNGGKVEAYWKDVYILRMPDGTEMKAEAKRDVILTDSVHGENVSAPIRGLYIVKSTNKYSLEQDQTEREIELEPVKKVLRELFDQKVEVFTTRPDTLFGATYLVLSPEHEKVQEWIESGVVTNVKEIKKYQDQTRKKTDIERQENKEKTGVELKGIVAINPADKKEIPVWIADYVLSGYGTGAIMAVPAHDERDFEFAKKFELPVIEVVVQSEEVAGFGALIQDLDGNFYFQQRDNKAKRDPGMIAPFGGGKEKGEDIFGCIKREIKEELGIEIADYKIHTIGTFPSKNTPGQNLKMVHLLIGPISSTNEGSGVVKLKLDEALKNEKVTEFTKEVLRYYTANAYNTFVESGIAVNSQFLDGLEAPKATEKMIAWLEKEKVGERKTTFKLRDWVFSRQRYWGEPIPMAYCEHCGWNPISDKELPLVLPDVKNYEPTDTGESPLSTMVDWVKTSCPICQGEARRETDTMPNWAGSSWYFLRYCDPNNKEAFASRRAMEYWMPVDLYNGGMEHTTLHLLYSRFWYKFLFDRGFVPASCGSEPYASRRSHAMILGEGGIKMSKSKGNVINPDDVVAEFGADVFRVYEMFMGPYDMDAPWDTHGIQGVKRFLDKAWNIGTSHVARPTSQSSSETRDVGRRTQDEYVNVFDLEDVRPYENILHQTIKKIGDDIDNLRFNTAVSALMILTNELQTADLRGRDFESYLKILAPFAPHMTEELWHMQGREDSIHASAWPAHDPDKLKVSEVEIAIQINGKVRGQVLVPAGSDEAFVRQAAEQVENVKKHLEGKTPKKIIYIKDKILSFVI